MISILLKMDVPFFGLFKYHLTKILLNHFALFFKHKHSEVDGVVGYKKPPAC